MTVDPLPGLLARAAGGDLVARAGVDAWRRAVARLGDRCATTARASALRMIRDDDLEGPEDMPAMQLGEYRPAARLEKGWHIRKGGAWVEIADVVQVVSPVGLAMLTLADGTEGTVPHTHEVICRPDAT